MIRRKATRIELKQEDIQEFEDLYQRRRMAMGDGQPKKPLGEHNHSHSHSQMQTQSQSERIRGQNVNAHQRQ